VRIILISPGRTTQRVNWTESGKPVSVTLPTQVPPAGYSAWLARDFCPLPNRDPGGTEFYPSFTKSSLAVPKLGLSAKPTPSRRAHTTRTTWEATIHPRNPLHFPGPLKSNLELADMTVASCRIFVAMRDLIAIIHRESRIPSRRTRMDLVLVSSRRRSRH
jgi:hypothetical protein